MRQKNFSLGIEFSTQSVKIVLIDVYARDIVYTAKFDYDTAFARYQTTGGVLKSDDPDIRHTSPLMLIEAVDHVFEKLQQDGVDLTLVSAVKIDGMQHCSVYTNEKFPQALKKLSPQHKLVDQIKHTISRNSSPIWEDRSPVKQAQALADILTQRGKDIAALTGNRAELRFPASQIMKWAKESPEEYSATKHIFVLSAFLTSILAGKIAAVDTGDGWGTNFNNLNIKCPGWDASVLDAVDFYLKGFNVKGTLRSKIGLITHYDAAIGRIGKYFTERYGVNPRAMVLAGTGDNPATLLGCGGRAVISLGSSYTVNGVMENIVPSLIGEYNVFGYTKGKAMALACITNGGKLHDHFLEKYFSGKEKSWEAYLAAAGARTLVSDEKLLLPFLMDESVPLRKKGIAREGFDEKDAGINIRSLHVSQALSLKIHSAHLSNTAKICVVGGGSKNPFLCQCLSDVFNAAVYRIKNADFAAPLGCAISGARAMLGVSYEEACERFVQEDPGSLIKPLEANQAAVSRLIARYRMLESA